MNIEYLRLADKNTAVVDEEGNLRIINDEVTGEELVAENKLEIITKSIDETKMKVNECSEIISLSKVMLKIQPAIAAGGVLLGLVAGGAQGGLMYLIGAASACLPTIAIFGIAYPVASKRLEGYKGKLAKAEELKKEQIAIIKRENTPIRANQAPINKPISLSSQNKIELPIVESQLDAAYDNAIEQRPKRRILKHNNINKI